MLNKILQTWQNNKLLRLPAESRHPVPYHLAKDVGVLFSDELVGESAAVNGFVEQLQREGKRVRALTFFERPHSNPYAFKFDYFTKKELTPFGNIRNEKVDQFTGFAFDYLFCINQEAFLPFDTILLKSRAKFRVGTYVPGKEKYFEVMVKPADGAMLAACLDQMYQYTLLLTNHES
jgi:hypothetical protein